VGVSAMVLQSHWGVWHSVPQRKKSTVFACGFGNVIIGERALMRVLRHA
jgi:hypothetical protein